MKKNVLTKAATLAVALLMVSGLSACGSSKANKTLQENGKPESISVMATTILTEQNGHDEFCEEYYKQTGIKLTIEKPEHNQYYEKVGITFAAGEPADVVELGSTYYPSYAAEGVLWDMTDAWENSDLYKNSDVVTDATKEYINVLRTDGDIKGVEKEAAENNLSAEETEKAVENVTSRIYGFPNQRGGGTVTYVRKDWMDALGITELPTNYDEFYDMLLAFKTIGECEATDSNGVTYKEKYKDDNTYPLTVAGLISTESPYEMYLREFYQDAQPDIHLDESTGKYVDGVLTPEMKAALERIKQAWKDRLIDPGSVSNKTSTCRDKFQSGLVGCFNYWAGTWNKTLDKNLQSTDPTAEMIALPAIDNANYIERPATAYVIPNFGAGDDYYQAVFDNFILFSHDGAEGQLLFTYGVEGVHYEVAETDDNGKMTKGTALPTMADTSTTFEKSFYDGNLSITNFAYDGCFEIDERITTSLAVFDDENTANKTKVYVLPVMDSDLANELTNIQVAKEQLLTNLVIEDMTPGEALAVYASDTAADRESVYETLNNGYSDDEKAADEAMIAELTSD